MWSMARDLQQPGILPDHQYCQQAALMLQQDATSLQYAMFQYVLRLSCTWRRESEKETESVLASRLANDE